MISEHQPMNKQIITFSLALFILACAGKDSSNNESSADGSTLYKKYCILCHGADGKLGINGAKDITTSLLTQPERIALVKSGKNTMTPFEGILSPEEMKAVVTYSMTLK
jgi:cytochrome c6